MANKIATKNISDAYMTCFEEDNSTLNSQEFAWEIDNGEELWYFKTAEAAEKFEEENTDKL